MQSSSTAGEIKIQFTGRMGGHGRIPPVKKGFQDDVFTA